MTLVLGSIAFRTALRSDVSTYVDRTPKREKSLVMTARLGPYTEAVLTMCAPASRSAKYAVQWPPCLSW